MRFSLPDSLYIHNRLVEVTVRHGAQEPEQHFRLTDKFKQSLIEDAPTRPIPALPPTSISPVQAVPNLADYLRALNQRVLVFSDYRERLMELANLLIEMAGSQPDGVIAAIMLCPYRHYAAHHAINCALLAARVGQSYGLPSADTEQLVCAALTMNVSSASLQDSMASQQAEPSTAQRQTLHAHPLLSSALLREAGVDDVLWHTIVLLHHEKKNGRGYPFSLAGEDVEPLAHLLHALDLVTAKMMPRTYRARMKPKQALGELYAGKMGEIDPELVSHLVKVIGIYPPGSFVELADGNRAIVVNITANAATPRVAPQTRPAERIDTAQECFRIVKSLNIQVEERYLPLFYRLWSPT
ncbi:HD-GYP domain-containing protein [Pseudogulbenkiania ferrooxidans]|uniref:Putative metal dependent phosphohydrolase n=1 Tax=Pseudogulbenkiania ferrooxidans 2002 TaxID=279714 RepID=B9Z3P4_9NEIS|nr:HD domain-containing phosphohydrolase [Pseudogulbenkiania ferrooxidans]EEG08471.1 putative metal dependent phosphohydrolase [Pseudogulbenkiania ferrooxidans 2002]